MSAPDPSPAVVAMSATAFRHRVPRPLLWLASLAVLAGLAYGGWWWSVARTLEVGLESWRAAESAAGGRVTIGQQQISGFPGFLRLDLRDIVWERADGVVWDGASLTIEARPWAIGSIAFTLRDGHQLRAPLAGGAWLIARAQEGKGLLSLAVGDDLYLGHLTLRNLQLYPVLAPAVSPASFPSPTTPSPPPDSVLRLEALDASLRQPATPPADFTQVGLSGSLHATRLHLPAALPNLFDTTVIDSLGLALRVMGAPPQPTATGLETWSRAGGVLEVDGASLDWGKLSAALTATVSLDAQLQPQLAGTLDVRGGHAVLDMLVEQNIIRRKDAALARTALSLLAQPRGEDPEPVLSLPLTIQERAIFLGPLKLLTMPWVIWSRNAPSANSPNG